HPCVGLKKARTAYFGHVKWFVTFVFALAFLNGRQSRLSCSNQLFIPRFLSREEFLGEGISVVCGIGRGIVTVGRVEKVQSGISLTWVTFRYCRIHIRQCSESLSEV